jgi:hypothetical protein
MNYIFFISALVVGIILKSGNLPGNEAFKNEIAPFFPA